MSHIEEKIEYLNSLGIAYNIESGKNWLLAELENYHDIEDENYPLWLILRSMGNHHMVHVNGDPFCERVTTFGFEQFFSYNKLSNIFAEIQRITKGTFYYKTIQEFDAIYNIDGSRTNEEFWNDTTAISHRPYLCKYEICGHDFEFEYHFTRLDPTSLNPEFISILSEKLPAVFLENNLNYFLEDFITFLAIPQQSQKTLIKDQKLNLKTNLVLNNANPILKKIELPNIDKSNIESSIHSYRSNQVIDENTHTRLGNYLLKDDLKKLNRTIDSLELDKKNKVNQLLKLFISLPVFAWVIYWISNHEIFDILLFRIIVYLFIGFLVFLVILAIIKSNIKQLNKSIEEHKNQKNLIKRELDKSKR